MTAAQYNLCVSQYADFVYRFILKQAKNSTDAEDIVQNAFEILWKKHEEVSFEKAKSYLFTVAHNSMIDMFRKVKRMDYRETLPDSGQVAHNSYTGVGEVLEDALKQIPEIQRSAVLLRDYEGYSYQEIGEILSLNESQVKVYIFRARKTLQHYLTSIDNVI